MVSLHKRLETGGVRQLSWFVALFFFFFGGGGAKMVALNKTCHKYMEFDYLEWHSFYLLLSSILHCKRPHLLTWEFLSLKNSFVSVK